MQPSPRAGTHYLVYASQQSSGVSGTGVVTAAPHPPGEDSETVGPGIRTRMRPTASPLKMPRGADA